MKFVDNNKSYTKKPPGSEGERRLRLNTGKRKTVEFSEHLMHDPQVLIGQWISIIDKIFSKPKGENPLATPSTNYATN